MVEKIVKKTTAYKNELQYGDRNTYAPKSRKENIKKTARHCTNTSIDSSWSAIKIKRKH